MTWQPIDTAPKEWDKPILAYGNDGDHKFAVAVWDVTPCGTKLDWHYTSGGTEIDFYPTHWHPLPEPPADKNK
jgi:hypothetical protein